MKIPKEELIAILSQFNPWWRRESIPDLPSWRRAVFNELLAWIREPPAPRAVLLSGPRQVGKTTLLLQAIDDLLKAGVNPANILYATFDHPVFKLAGLESVLEAWRELEPKAEGPEYLFLDEAQFIRDFGTWAKHQVDFFKHRRIVFTGSAMPLVNSNQESGVGRWHMLRISTLSFYEYLQIKKIALPTIPSINALSDLFTLKTAELHRLTESAQSLIGHFHEYLIRGGFPQTALVESVSQSQRLLREDIIDKVLKRDMTAIFGVRRILELEQMFIYLCMHDGGQQDLQSLASNLGVAKPTVQNFIELFESTHLLYRLPPFGYGKEVLRARYKLYLADAAISSAILMKGKTILEHADSLGRCVETCVIAHLSAHNSLNNARFSYWQNIKTKEVDLIVEMDDRLIPFEVKYQSHLIHENDVSALIEFSQRTATMHIGYILTKAPQDIGILPNRTIRLMRIPASLLCYWIGEAELSQKNLLVNTL
jgi:predicted AAA+ superfamily ATPase